MAQGMALSLALLVVALASGTQAAAGTLGRHVSLGKCPNITNKADFDAVPYLGRWYEQERYDIVFQSGMDCVNAVYSDMGNGYVEVHNTARTSYGDFTDIVGQAHVIEPGVLLVEFAGYIPAEYHILATDYENYSSVYNCFEEGEYHWQYAWLLTREMTPSEELLATARQAFSDNGVDLSLFHVTYQGEDCPYLA